MQGFDLLTVVAEIAVAFAGFASIVVVFQQRREAWSELQRHRIQVMLQTALLTIGYALLPIPVLELGVGEPELWLVCGGLVWVVSFLHNTFFVVRKYLRLRRSGRFPIRHRWFKVSVSTGYAVNLLLLATVLGLAPLNPRGVYSLLLLWNVSVCGQMFALLVTAVAGPDGAGDFAPAGGAGEARD